MAGKTSFDIRYTLRGAEQFPEMAARVRDLRPAFDVIVEKWARGNVDKFEKSKGMESSGAQIYDVFWQGLKPSTMRAKRRKGQVDHLMVATGALEEALTTQGRFFAESTAERAAFGTPMSIEEEMKVRYNWAKRQAIFLSYDDQLMIEETVQSYLSLGPKFESIRFGQGMENLRDHEEVAHMEVGFNEAMKAD